MGTRKYHTHLDYGRLYYNSIKEKQHHIDQFSNLPTKGSLTTNDIQGTQCHIRKYVKRIVIDFFR